MASKIGPPPVSHFGSRLAAVFRNFFVLSDGTHRSAPRARMNSFEDFENDTIGSVLDNDHRIDNEGRSGWAEAPPSI